MLRTRPPHAAVIGTVLLLVLAGASAAGGQTFVSEVVVPGGLREALRATGDRVAPSRAHFLAEFIRRTYNTPLTSPRDPRWGPLQALVTAIDRPPEPAADADTIPLPLPAAYWIEDVFGGRATPETLLSAIVQSRSASLFYCGLLSLDDETRVWLTRHRPLMAELASRHAAAFLAAAPGLRVSAAGLRLPGGVRAAAVWEALAGRSPDDPPAFLRALLSSDDGQLASFFGAMGRLTGPQVAVAQNLDSPDLRIRIESARRLFSVFVRVTGGHLPDQRAFARPALDPALLMGELATDAGGRPVVPGTRGLWSEVFGSGDARAAAELASPADFPWLCEQVFGGPPAEDRARYMMVLFASRHLGPGLPAAGRDAVRAIRAVVDLPALTASLERAGVTDLAVFASAAARASMLSRINEDSAASVALAQFQGALALVTRAAVRGSVSPHGATALVSSLSAIAPTDRGAYEGRLSGWLERWLAEAFDGPGLPHEHAGPPAGSGADATESDSLEARALRLLAGRAAVKPRVVEWEGTRYHLDLATAEAARLARAFGGPPSPHLSSASTAFRTAEALADPRLTPEALSAWQPRLDDLARFLSEARLDTRAPGRDGQVARTLLRAARAGDLRAARGVTRELRRLADDLLARGLMELAYAAALGDREGVSIPAADAASRHDFGFQFRIGRRRSWAPPVPGSGVDGRWHVTGSVLGLDVALASFSLVRPSSRPPARPPTLSEVDRRVFTETVALVEPRALTDADRDTIVAAIRRGRARLAAARTPEDVSAIAGVVRLGAGDRTLLAWTAAHDAGRLAGALAPVELLWLGLGDREAGTLQAWGAPAGPRQGCLCLRLADRPRWDAVAGRWHAGLLGSVFPDLNLRLAELLGELQMPAALLAPVLGSATLEFVESAVTRDPDDRRGLVEFVHALTAERLEQYLALLTSDGPLVPIRTGDGQDADAPRPGPPMTQAVR